MFHKYVYTKEFSAMKRKDFYAKVHYMMPEFCRHLLCVMILHNSTNDFHHWCEEIAHMIINLKLYKGKSRNYTFDDVKKAFNEASSLFDNTDHSKFFKDLLNLLNNDEHLRLPRTVLTKNLELNFIELALKLLKLYAEDVPTADDVEEILSAYNTLEASI